MYFNRKDKKKVVNQKRRKEENMKIRIKGRAVPIPERHFLEYDLYHIEKHETICSNTDCTG